MTDHTNDKPLLSTTEAKKILRDCISIASNPNPASLQEAEKDFKKALKGHNLWDVQHLAVSDHQLMQTTTDGKIIQQGKSIADALFEEFGLKSRMEVKEISIQKPTYKNVYLDNDFELYSPISFEPLDWLCFKRQAGMKIPASTTYTYKYTKKDGVWGKEDFTEPKKKSRSPEQDRAIAEIKETDLIATHEHKKHFQTGKYWRSRSEPLSLITGALNNLIGFDIDPKGKWTWLEILNWLIDQGYFPKKLLERCYCVRTSVREGNENSLDDIRGEGFHIILAVPDYLSLIEREILFRDIPQGGDGITYGLTDVLGLKDHFGDSGVEIRGTTGSLLVPAGEWTYCTKTKAESFPEVFTVGQKLSYVAINDIDLASKDILKHKLALILPSPKLIKKIKEYRQSKNKGKTSQSLSTPSAKSRISKTAKRVFSLDELDAGYKHLLDYWGRIKKRDGTNTLENLIIKTKTRNNVLFGLLQEFTKSYPVYCQNREAFVQIAVKFSNLNFEDSLPESEVISTANSALNYADGLLSDMQRRLLYFLDYQYRIGLHMNTNNKSKKEKNQNIYNPCSLTYQDEPPILANSEYEMELYIQSRGLNNKKVENGYSKLSRLVLATNDLFKKAKEDAKTLLWFFDCKVFAKVNERDWIGKKVRFEDKDNKVGEIYELGTKSTTKGRQVSLKTKSVSELELAKSLEVKKLYTKTVWLPGISPQEFLTDNKELRKERLATYNPWLRPDLSTHELAYRTDYWGYQAATDKTFKDLPELRRHWDLWLEFIEKSLQNSANDQIKPFHFWVSNLVNRPDKKLPLLPILYDPDHGGGKTTVAETLHALFHPFSASCSKTEQFLGQFNAVIAYNVFLHLEEQAPEKSAKNYASLKAFTGSKITLLERKGIDPEETYNYSNGFMTVNGIDSFLIEKANRRLCIYEWRKANYNKYVLPIKKLIDTTDEQLKQEFAQALYIGYRDYYAEKNVWKWTHRDFEDNIPYNQTMKEKVRETDFLYILIEEILACCETEDDDYYGETLLDATPFYEDLELKKILKTKQKAKGKERQGWIILTKKELHIFLEKHLKDNNLSNPLFREYSPDKMRKEMVVRLKENLKIAQKRANVRGTYLKFNVNDINLEELEATFAPLTHEKFDAPPTKEEFGKVIDPDEI